jgi:hypothetical protein
MMRKLYSEKACSGIFRRLPILLYGLLALAVSGCGPDKSDGNVIFDPDPEGNKTVLTTSTRLGLQCEDVGIFNEPCVLDDKDNPFRTTVILEFDPELPDDQRTKFDQIDELIPEDRFCPPDTPECCPADNPDCAGLVSWAKSRFYFWATALARQPNVGENQFLTATALHELYTAGGGANGGSINAREQAKKAYRSVLDNYFGASIFIELDDPDSEEPDDTVVFPLDLSQLTAVALVTPTNLETLFPGVDPELNAIVELGDWGYTYVPPPAGVPGEPEPLPTLIPINFVPIQF